MVLLQHIPLVFYTFQTRRSFALWRTRAWTFHIAHCTLHISHCTFHIAHCTLHIAHFTLPIAHCTLLIAHCTLHISHFTLLISHCTLHISHCLLHIAHCTLHFGRTACSSVVLAAFIHTHAIMNVHVTHLQKAGVLYSKSLHARMEMSDARLRCLQGQGQGQEGVAQAPSALNLPEHVSQTDATLKMMQPSNQHRQANAKN
jgi:hypothetical protein